MMDFNTSYPYQYLLNEANHAADKLKENRERFRKKLNLYKDFEACNKEKSVTFGYQVSSKDKSGGDAPIRKSNIKCPSCSSKLHVLPTAFVTKEGERSFEVKAFSKEADESVKPMTQQGTDKIYFAKELGLGCNLRPQDSGDWGYQTHALLLGLLKLSDGSTSSEGAGDKKSVTSERPRPGRKSIFRLPGNPYSNPNGGIPDLIERPGRVLEASGPYQ